jgi:hypothetical protein
MSPSNKKLKKPSQGCHIILNLQIPCTTWYSNIILDNSAQTNFKKSANLQDVSKIHGITSGMSSSYRDSLVYINIGLEMHSFQVKAF